MWVAEIPCLCFRTLAEILAIWSPAEQSTYLEITALLLAVSSLRKWLRAGSQLKLSWSSISRVMLGLFLQDVSESRPKLQYVFDVKELENEMLNP